MPDDPKKEYRSGWEREAETLMGAAGTRDEYQGHGPRGYQRSPDRIREEVCEALTDDAAIDACDIEVTVEGGDVILSGSVPTRDMKRLAETAAERIQGVVQVRNGLAVREATAH
jgi:osmotically-inducible protein OsmY